MDDGKRQLVVFPFTFDFRGKVDAATHCEGCGLAADAHESVGPVWTDYPGAGVYGVPNGSPICGTWSDARENDETARALREFLRGTDISMWPNDND